MSRRKLHHATTEEPFNPFPWVEEGNEVGPSIHQELVFTVGADDFVRISQPEHRHRFVEHWDGQTMQMHVQERSLVMRGLSRALGISAHPYVYLETGLPRSTGVHPLPAAAKSEEVESAAFAQKHQV